MQLVGLKYRWRRAQPEVDDDVHDLNGRMTVVRTLLKEDIFKEDSNAKYYL